VVAIEGRYRPFHAGVWAPSGASAEAAAAQVGRRVVAIVVAGSVVFTSGGGAAPGQPHSIGHLIDLVAALLGITFVAMSFLLRRWKQQRSNFGAH
jgi:hypothetical protein